MPVELILLGLGVALVLLLLWRCPAEGYAANMKNMSAARGFDPISAPLWSGGIRPRTLKSEHRSVHYERGPMV